MWLVLLVFFSFRAYCNGRRVQTKNDSSRSFEVSSDSGLNKGDLEPNGIADFGRHVNINVDSVAASSNHGFDRKISSADPFAPMLLSLQPQSGLGFRNPVHTSLGTNVLKTQAPHLSKKIRPQEVEIGSFQEHFHYGTTSVRVASVLGLTLLGSVASAYALQPSAAGQTARISTISNSMSLRASLPVMKSGIPNGEGQSQMPRDFRRRWFMLTLYSLVGILNFGMWLTYATLPGATYIAFDHARPWKGNLLAVIVGFGYLIGALPAQRVLADTTNGIRKGMLCASLIGVASGSLRWLGGSLRTYWFALLGQLLVGIAQPFFMAAPAQLSMHWFPKQERGLATSIGILSQVLGQAAIFIVGPAVASLPSLVIAQAFVAVLLLSAVWLWFQDRPPVTRESSGNAENETAEMHGKTQPGTVLTRAFGVLALTSGTCIGAFWTCCTVIGELLLPLGYTEAQIGYLGFSFIASGMAGLLCAGPLMDKTKAYKKGMLLCAWGSTFASWALFAVAFASNFFLLLIVCSVLGFWLTAIQAVALETAVEITYPEPESKSSGIIFGYSVGVYCLLPFLAMKASLRSVLMAQSLVFSAMSMLLTVCFQPKYLRQELQNS